MKPEVKWISYKGVDILVFESDSPTIEEGLKTYDEMTKLTKIRKSRFCTLHV